MSETFKTEAGTILPLISLKGKQYLQVQHRIVWFRERYPMGRIDTEIVKLTDEFAICSASIHVPVGDGSYVKLADAMKREDGKHFPDYIEKAQTSAIGRALALCGFGTQFAPDVDEEHRIVDAPVERMHNPHQAISKPMPAPKSLPVPKTTTPALATQAQPAASQPYPEHVTSLIETAKLSKVRKDDLEKLITLRYPEVSSIYALTQAQVKTLIGDLLKLPVTASTAPIGTSPDAPAVTGSPSKGKKREQP